MILALALSPGALADDPNFTPEVHVRPRLELDTGEDAAEGGGRFFVVQRSRLGVRAELGAVTGRIAIQDSRLWGSEANPGKVTAEDLDLRIAEVILRPSESVAITVGRQEIRWHEERFLAIANWQPVGRVFDAVRLDVEQGAFHTQAFGAVTGEGDSATESGWSERGDAWTAGAFAGVKTGSLLIDGVYLLDTDMSVDRIRHTTGLYAKATRGILEGRLEAYAQLGVDGDDALQAGMLALYGSVAPEVNWKPKVTLWYDVLSGDGDADDGVWTAFDMVYGAKHKFMGIADIVYYQVGGPTDGLGLHNPALKLTASPAEGWTVNVDGHLFFEAAPQGPSPWIGQEVDLYGAWQLNPLTKLAAGSGVFQGADDRPLDLFAWLQLDLRY